MDARFSSVPTISKPIEELDVIISNATVLYSRRIGSFFDVGLTMSAEESFVLLDLALFLARRFAALRFWLALESDCAFKLSSSRTITFVLVFVEISQISW